MLAKILVLLGFVPPYWLGLWMAANINDDWEMGAMVYGFLFFFSFFSVAIFAAIAGIIAPHVSGGAHPRCLRGGHGHPVRHHESRWVVRFRADERLRCCRADRRRVEDHAGWRRRDKSAQLGQLITAFASS